MLRQGKGINFFLIESQLYLTRADSAESEVYEHPNLATAKITINFYQIFRMEIVLKFEKQKRVQKITCITGFIDGMG